MQLFERLVRISRHSLISLVACEKAAKKNDKPTTTIEQITSNASGYALALDQATLIRSGFKSAGGRLVIQETFKSSSMATSARRLVVAVINGLCPIVALIPLLWRRVYYLCMI